MKRTSRSAGTPRYYYSHGKAVAVAPHECVIDNQGTCHWCGRLMDRSWWESYAGKGAHAPTALPIRKSKRTSRNLVANSAKRTSRRPTQPHICLSSSQGLCRTCGKLMDSVRFHDHGVEQNGGISKEFAMLEAIDVVRAAAPRVQLTFLPADLRSELLNEQDGVYSYAAGKLRAFPRASLGGAVTSTRIATQKTGEHHWVVDKHGGYPVVVRVFDPSGQTIYRVEEYAERFSRKRSSKRTSRSKAA